MMSDEELYMGFANNQIRLDFGQLLTNVNRIQGRNNIALAQSLASGVKDVGHTQHIIYDLGQ